MESDCVLSFVSTWFQTAMDPGRRAGQEKEVTQLSPTIQHFEERQGEAEEGGG